MRRHQPGNMGCLCRRGAGGWHRETHGIQPKRGLAHIGSETVIVPLRTVIRCASTDNPYSKTFKAS